MDEPLARLAVVAAVASLALLGAWIWRRRPRSRRVTLRGLGPGVVLFTSSTCSTCDEVRELVRRWSGPDGHREIGWESDPEAFERYAIARVPSVAVLDDRGEGHLWEGTPPRRPIRRAAGGA